MAVQRHLFKLKPRSDVKYLKYLVCDGGKKSHSHYHEQIVAVVTITYHLFLQSCTNLLEPHFNVFTRDRSDCAHVTTLHIHRGKT